MTDLLSVVDFKSYLRERTDDPSVHGSLFEGRFASPYFRIEWFSAQYGQVRERVLRGISASALEDYLTHGASEFLNPNPWFEELWYRRMYPEADARVKSGHFLSGLHHFVALGARDGLRPGPRFSEVRYLGAHADVTAAVKSGAFNSGFEHYLFHGEAEGRSRGTDLVIGVPRQGIA